MATARNDMAETAVSRSNVYGFLAVAFRAEPPAELLAQLRSPGFATVLRSLDLSFGDEFHDAPVETLIEDLSIEYTRLFIGPGPHVSPHESMNIDVKNPKDAGLWGPQTVQVKKFIEAAGLNYDDSFTGMPDHVSAELEFMQRLTQKEAEAWAEQDDEAATNILKIEERFFDEHLSQWVCRFCDRIIERGQHAFYLGFAKLLKEFLDYESGRFQATSTEEKSGRAAVS